MCASMYTYVCMYMYTNAPPRAGGSPLYIVMVIVTARSRGPDVEVEVEISRRGEEGRGEKSGRRG